jgi:uroporphyrinogen decarboxylase
MTNRENVLAALRRSQPERVPFDFVLCPSHVQSFKQRTGHKDYMEYFQFPFRYIDPNPTRLDSNYDIYFKDLPADAAPLAWNPEWGVKGINSGVEHFQKMLHPMARFESTEQFQAYPFPDFKADYRWHGMDKKVQQLKKRDLVAVAFMQMTIFEIAWYLRGLDEFLLDMMLNPKLAIALLDIITDIRIVMADRFARAGVDILMLGDDVATQRGMMFAPSLWRELLKDRLAAVIRAAKQANPDVLVFYHSDGNPGDIIEELIQIGVDVLNPIQPECMDPFQLKKEYGDRLSFWGTVGTQQLMPFGTPNEVREQCKKLMQAVGKGGGLLLAPTHVLEPEVPWANIEAFLQSVQEFGTY